MCKLLFDVNMVKWSKRQSRGERITESGVRNQYIGCITRSPRSPQSGHPSCFPPILLRITYTSKVAASDDARCLCSSSLTAADSGYYSPLSLQFFQALFPRLSIMQVRRPSGVTPLAIVLPHPPLPRRRSSLLSATSISSPRTPSCGSPKCSTLFFNNATNRKSTDSWNSSNADDCEWEWKPEQTLLLSRVRLPISRPLGRL